MSDWIVGLFSVSLIESMTRANDQTIPELPRALSTRVSEPRHLRRLRLAPLDAEALIFQ